MLGIFWLGSREIGFSSCLAQMSFTHTFSLVESGVPTATALDRYVTVCHPLWHSSILSVLVLVALRSLVLVHGVLLVSPVCFLLPRMPFCQHQVVSYCGRVAVVKLACGDTGVSDIYGLFVALTQLGSDTILTSVSYTMVLRVVMRLSSTEAPLKPFSTWVGHVCHPSLLRPCPLHVPHPPVWAEQPSPRPCNSGQSPPASAPHIKPHRLRGENQKLWDSVILLLQPKGV